MGLPQGGVTTEALLASAIPAPGACFNERGTHKRAAPNWPYGRAAAWKIAAPAQKEQGTGGLPPGHVLRRPVIHII